MVTPAADVYALGVLLAELATGRRPPPAAGVVAGSTVETDPLVDRLPDPVRRVVVRCTQVEPNDRYADASQVLHEFDRAVKQIPG